MKIIEDYLNHDLAIEYKEFKKGIEILSKQKPAVILSNNDIPNYSTIP